MKYKVEKEFRVYDDEGSDLFKPEIGDTFEVSSNSEFNTFLIYNDKGYDLNSIDFKELENSGKIVKLNNF